MKPFDVMTSRLVRWIGILGLLYEIFLDHVRNPTALVVFGGLSEGPALLRYWSASRQAQSGQAPARNGGREGDGE